MSRHRLTEEVTNSGNEFVDICNVCKQRRSIHFDDFFGYLCNLCYIKYPLKWKQRNVNPWTGRPLDGEEGRKTQPGTQVSDQSGAGQQHQRQEESRAGSSR